MDLDTYIGTLYGFDEPYDVLPIIPPQEECDTHVELGYEKGGSYAYL